MSPIDKYIVHNENIGKFIVNFTVNLNVDLFSKPTKPKQLTCSPLGRLRPRPSK